MSQNLAFADYAVFIIYFIVVSVYGYTVYRKREKNEHDAKAYFLAEGTLTWWAIGDFLDCFQYFGRAIYRNEW